MAADHEYRKQRAAGHGAGRDDCLRYGWPSQQNRILFWCGHDQSRELPDYGSVCCSDLHSATGIRAGNSTAAQAVERGGPGSRSGQPGHGYDRNYRRCYTVCRGRSRSGDPMHCPGFDGGLSDCDAGRSWRSCATRRPDRSGAGSGEQQIGLRDCDHRRNARNCVVYKPRQDDVGRNSAGSSGGSMKIVAVTACPTGIAHTYMAAARLEKVARELGHEIKVETQGAMGIENRLSDQDIREAKAAIFAVDVNVEGRERFHGMKIVEVPLQEAIKNTRAVFAKV